jgi:hypothetical protein
MQGNVVNRMETMLTDRLRQTLAALLIAALFAALVMALKWSATYGIPEVGLPRLA